MEGIVVQFVLLSQKVVDEKVFFGRQMCEEQDSDAPRQRML